MPAAGQKLRAADFPDAVTDTENTSGTTTSTTYTTTLTGGTTCQVTFIAPTSGRVEIAYGCQIVNSGANNTFMTIELRTGAVVGSGAIITAAADDNGVLATSTAVARYGVAIVVTGLTAGSSYNVQQFFRVAAGTGTFSRKYLTVKPLS